MKANLKLYSVITILVLLMAAVPAMSAGATATTLYVDAAGNCGGNSPCYTHPQDAVNAANPGDTILVYPGTYDSRYQVCDPVHPTWCAPNDNWAPALIVYKDNLTIKSVEGPANTIIQSTHTFWSNAIAVQHSTAGGLTGITGWAPSAAVIVANNVTIDGFTFHRPFNCSVARDCFSNTAGVFIGSKGAGYTDFLGHANGATVKNNVFSNVWHAVYIWHSSGNQIINNKVAALGNTGHWAAISAYDGWDDASAALQPQSINNIVAYNELADKGISLGAWAPSTWTSNAGSKVLCNTTTQVGVAYSHGPVTIGGNTGTFWQQSTDSVLNITGIIYAGPSAPVPVDSVTHQAALTLSADLVYGGTSNGGGIPVTFYVDDVPLNATTTAGGFASITMDLAPGVYNIKTGVAVCATCEYTDSAVLVIYDPSGGFVTGGGWIDSPAGAYKLDDHNVLMPVWNQGFESNADGWLDSTSGWYGTVTRVPSGTSGVISSGGAYHAVLEGDADSGPFTRFDQFRSVWPGTWLAEIDVYLDPAWTNGQGFDYSVAATGTDGNHQRDYIFHVTKDTSTGKLFVAGSNNTNFAPREDLENINHYEVTSAGWYTLQHVFRDQGGALAVDLNLLDATGNVLFTESRYDASDQIPQEVGGNRYGWFAFINIGGGIAVDEHQLFVPVGPTGKATFGFVSKYKKGASVPEGNTEFVFQAGNLSFHSTSYEWLVVTGSNYAKFKGAGTINGALDPNGNAYKFQLWAGDGSPDTFRIKIWYEQGDNEIVVYDNGADQAIGAGSIVVHTK